MPTATRAPSSTRPTADERASTRCPACGDGDLQPLWTVAMDGSEGGVSADVFRPSSTQYRQAVSAVVRCAACGHGVVATYPDERQVTAAYASAADPVSLREEAGQVETARTAMALLEAYVAPGRLLEVGCWTGSALVAAQERGWDVLGVEPSAWAARRASERGVDVVCGELDPDTGGTTPFRAAMVCDVLEHLADPATALETLHDLIEPGGALYLTVPDAGSLLARAMGRRWWAVLPMHLQYFTRGSMTTLLARCGFERRHVGSHAKVFSVQYYAERFAGFVPGSQRAAAWVGGRRFADRLVAPDFHDRMAIVARRV